MPDAVKTWGSRFKLIVQGAAALTAAIGVATAAINSYTGLQEARQARSDASTSYGALASKINSMAERLAFVEGMCLARVPAAVQPHVPAPAPVETPPELPAPAEDGAHTELMMDTGSAPKHFKVGAYQQLPASLDALVRTQQDFKE